MNKHFQQLESLVKQKARANPVYNFSIAYSAALNELGSASTGLILPPLKTMKDSLYAKRRETIPKSLKSFRQLKLSYQ